jgi:hypothetical protein
VNFTLAVGTYTEVMDWYNKGQVDVAILTGGPFIRVLEPFDPPPGERSDGYVASEILNPDPGSPLASNDRLSGKIPLFYRAVAIVPSFQS